MLGREHQIRLNYRKKKLISISVQSYPILFIIILKRIQQQCKIRLILGKFKNISSVYVPYIFKIYNFKTPFYIMHDIGRIGHIGKISISRNKTS